MEALIAEAHDRDIKVFFDIITNHTADVIQYEGGEYTYRNKAAYPYLDADGVAFDDRDYAAAIAILASLAVGALVQSLDREVTRVPA